MHVDLPVLSPKDIDDVQNFAVKNQMDFIAASFVQVCVEESRRGGVSVCACAEGALRSVLSHLEYYLQRYGGRSASYSALSPILARVFFTTVRG